MIILRTFYNIYDEPNEIGFFYNGNYWFTTQNINYPVFEIRVGTSVIRFVWLPEYRFRNNNKPLTQEFIDAASSHI